MKMTSSDALARLKNLNLAGSGPAENAVVEEAPRSGDPARVGEARAGETTQATRKRRAGHKSKREGTPADQGSRKSHSKGSSAAVVTGYLDPVHVEVLLDLRARYGTKSLSIPSANRLLKVALRLVKELKPSDAQVLAAFEAERGE